MNVPGSNVARHLRVAATEHPEGLATKSPSGVTASGEVHHESRTFRQLDQASDAAAELFARSGLVAGDRVLLAVRPGHDLIVGMFGLLKLGAVPVAIDPGMGWSSFLDCVRRSRPTGLVGLRSATLLSRLPLAAFRSLRQRVTVGGAAWCQALASASPAPRPLAEVRPDTLAAILFTSGSTGAPKGVCYTHGMFDAQIELVRATYGIRPGEIDMAMLPLFALFNPALGTTTVTPLLDPSRPLAADPAPLVAALIAEKVTCSFGSPAIWGKVTDYCETKGLELPDLRRLLIAGAPVSGELLAKLRVIAPRCVTHTPYGATECLPVTTITADELLGEARQLALRGQGTCVGRPVSGVEIRVIRETEGPIATLAEARACSPDEIGEIIATGPSVTREYDGLPEATRLAKIADGDRVWHRMGDLGALDASGRLFFFGRRVEKVRTADGDLPTESLEPAFRQHPQVFRCALIGLGGAPRQTPALVVEPRSGHFPETDVARARFVAELRSVASVHPQSDRVRHIVFQRALPVDVRHNAKIHRLQLAQEWSARLAR
ncbi:MAG: fatty acid CoA ligase family protein [Opitutales bacterium]|jgi:acyl-CoA synthetase (AMP-forming)/AMP-acid ligase II